MTVSEAEKMALTLADAEAGDFDTQAQVIPWIIEAEKEIVKSTECLMTLFTATTTANTEEYSLPTDFWKERRVKIGGEKAYFVEYDQLETMSETGEQTSKPRYTIQNGDLIFYKGGDITAGLAISMDYYQWPTTTLTATDSLDVPTEYTDLVPYFVAAKMAQANGEETKAALRLNEFTNRVRETRDNTRRTRRGSRTLKTELYDRYTLN